MLSRWTRGFVLGLGLLCASTTSAFAQQVAVFDAGGVADPVAATTTPWALAGGNTVQSNLNGAEVQITAGDASTTTVTVQNGMADDGDAILGTAVVDVAGGAANVTVTVTLAGSLVGGPDLDDAALLFSRAGGTATNAIINGSLSATSTGFIIRDTGNTANTITVATVDASVTDLTLVGAIELGNGSNILSFTAGATATSTPIRVLQDGGIKGGTGNDTLTLTAGASPGDAKLGAGQDDDVDLGAGTNSLTIATTGASTGAASGLFRSVTFGDGDDTVLVDTTGNTAPAGPSRAELVADDAAGGGTLALGGGTNQVTVIAGAGFAQALAVGQLTGGAGNDSLTVRTTGAGSATLGANGDVDLGAGNNAILSESTGAAANDQASFLAGGLTTGDGNDSITVRALSTGGNGNATFSSTGTVELGGGNDTITVTTAANAGGTALFLADGQDLNLGPGNDAFVLTAGATDASTTALTIDCADGTDQVTITAPGAGTALFDVTNVFLGSGDDTLTASGRVTVAALGTSVSLGDGNDTFNFSTSQAVALSVDGGLGDDNITVTGGAGVFNVDTLASGEGNDTITATAGAGGLDINFLNLDDTGATTTTKVVTLSAPGAGALTVNAYSALSAQGIDDTVTASGNVRFNTDLTMGGGTSVLTIDSNNGDALPNVAITTFAGDDAVSLKCSSAGGWATGLGTIDLGNGANTLTVDSTIGSFRVNSIVFGAGDDAFNINSNFVSEAATGTPFILTNSLNLSGANGNDTVTLNNGSFVLGGGTTLALGEGDTLRGNGFVAAADVTFNGSVADRATLSPGLSVGKLVVNGNLSLTNTNYALDVDGTSSDTVFVRNGTATVNAGNLVTVSFPNVTPPLGTTSYPILQTDATGSLVVNATPAVSSANLPLFSFALRSVPGVNGDFFLDVTRSSLADVPAITGNAGAVAANVEAILSGNLADADLASALNELTKLPSNEQLIAALTNLSGEAIGSGPGAEVTTLSEYNYALAARMSEMRGGLGSSPRPEGPRGPSGSVTDERQGVGLFAQAFGTLGRQDDDGDLLGYEVQTYGTALGIDKRLDDSYFIGASLAFARTDVNLDDPLGADGNVDDYAASLYAGYGHDRFFVDLAVTYGWTQSEFDRRLAFGPIDRAAHSDFDGREVTGYAGSGFLVMLGDTTYVVPSLALQYANVSQDGFQEEGAGGLGLDVSSRSIDSFRSIVGCKLGTRLGDDSSKWSLATHVGWIHEYAHPDHTVRARFLGAPDSARFTSESAEQGDDQANLGVGVSGQVSRQASVFLGYDANVSKNAFYQGVTGGVQINF
ncbi:MAG: autotransporter domain-containing protein [Planctomycetes bacterium]|nr:autotransporter domain-containing protein [Planctomycetota bacterium]